MDLKDYYESFITVKSREFLSKEYYLKALEYYLANPNANLINPEMVLGSMVFKKRNKLESLSKIYKFTISELQEIIQKYIFSYASAKELTMYFKDMKTEMEFLEDFFSNSQKYNLSKEQIDKVLKYYGRQKTGEILRSEELTLKVWQDIHNIKSNTDMNLVEVFKLYAQKYNIPYGTIVKAYYLHEYPVENCSRK